MMAVHCPCCSRNYLYCPCQFDFPDVCRSHGPVTVGQQLQASLSAVRNILILALTEGQAQDNARLAGAYRDVEIAAANLEHGIGRIFKVIAEEGDGA